MLAKGTVPDDQLDLSDIPEITDWSNAVRQNQFYRPVKQQTSIRLDADVLAWFKAQGKGYQTRMNEILRDAMLKELKIINKNGSLGSHFDFILGDYHSKI